MKVEPRKEKIYSDLSKVPKQYLDLKKVFNMVKATSLPLHRHYVCAIDLLLGIASPKGHLYLA